MVNWLNHKTVLTGWYEGTGHQTGGHVWLLAFICKGSRYIVPVYVFALWVKWPILVVLPKRRICYTHGVYQGSAVLFYIMFLFCLLKTLWLKDVNMAKIQKEPDWKEHSESMSGFWVGELIGVSQPFPHLGSMFSGEIFSSSLLLCRRLSATWGRTTLSCHLCFPFPWSRSCKRVNSHYSSKNEWGYQVLVSSWVKFPSTCPRYRTSLLAQEAATRLRSRRQDFVVEVGVWVCTLLCRKSQGFPQKIIAPS